MGGLGSTRWDFHSKKTVVEDCLVLDIGTFLKQVVQPSVFQSRRDWESSIIWRNTRSDEISASVGYRLSWLGEVPRVTLDYTVTYPNGERQLLNYTIALQSTPCTYGGERWWFSCPNCRRRVGKLYKPPLGSIFACRDCHDLTYTSTQEAHKFHNLGTMIPALDRYMRLEQKLQQCKRWRKRAYKLLAQMEAASSGLRSRFPIPPLDNLMDGEVDNQIARIVGTSSYKAPRAGC